MAREFDLLPVSYRIYFKTIFTRIWHIGLYSTDIKLIYIPYVINGMNDADIAIELVNLN